MKEEINSLPITLKGFTELEKGDVFLWKSRAGRYEIGSSEIVNYSGICGILECDEDLVRN